MLRQRSAVFYLRKGSPWKLRVDVVSKSSSASDDARGTHMDRVCDD